MLAVQADGCTVETIEGLSDSKELAQLQKAFHERNALQCGFCTPGMLMAAQDLVQSRREADAGRDPRAHLRQLLPLHRLPGDRRRDRGSDRMGQGAELPLARAGHAASTRGYIGQSVPRPNAQRLLQGRGAFIDDLRFPRLAHVAFFRSPYAHARIKQPGLCNAARQAPGVIAVLDGRAVAEYCTPWVAVLAHLKGIKSPPQHRDRHRARVLAGRGGGGGGRRVARAGRGRGGSSSKPSGRSCRSVDRHGRVACRQARDPPRARRQHLLQARARHRRRR